MELKFLGRGSGFNTNEGNTAAYFIEGDSLFLIDCGELVRAIIMKTGLLNGVKTVFFFCTHTHSDHVGSLGNLVLYCVDNLKIQFNLVLPTTSTLRTDLEELLRIFGCKGKYRVLDQAEFDNKFDTFSKVVYMETPHDKALPAYSIEFQTPDGVLFYSGDTSNADRIDYYLKTDTKIDKLFIDITMNEASSTYHIHIDRLVTLIPRELRSKCYCMHVNSDECIERALKLGFNVVTLEAKNK